MVAFRPIRPLRAALGTTSPRLAAGYRLTAGSLTAPGYEKFSRQNHDQYTLYSHPVSRRLPSILCVYHLVAIERSTLPGDRRGTHPVSITSPDRCRPTISTPLAVPERPPRHTNRLERLDWTYIQFLSSPLECPLECPILRPPRPSARGASKPRDSATFSVLDEGGRQTSNSPTP